MVEEDGSGIAIRGPPGDGPSKGLSQFRLWPQPGEGSGTQFVGQCGDAGMYFPGGSGRGHGLPDSERQRDWRFLAGSIHWDGIHGVI